jgi:NTP pyrophosphatase (non-canonical NTP hydrolase)
MSDANTSESVDHQIIETLRAFVAERDWAQFHSPANLAKSISIEAAELLECFQWDDEMETERVLGELADVLTYCYLLADRLGVEPSQVVLDKLAVTRAKYPIEKAYGQSTKHDRL